MKVKIKTVSKLLKLLLDFIFFDINVYCLKTHKKAIQKKKPIKNIL
jgi:hypothetical protein